MWFPFLRCILLASLLLSPPSTHAASDRLRVMIETDAGGDPDDEQSLVRFLLYANEWDVEGIIATRPTARAGENKNNVRTGLGIVQQQLDAYAQCYPNLILHDPRYPTPQYLRSRTVAGYADVPDGVRLIKQAVDFDDPRPIWFMNWGTDAGSAPSCLKRTLDEVLHERDQDGYAKFKNRIFLSSSDQFGDHTFKIDPPFPLWIDTFRPPMDGKRWYHRFSALTATAGGFNVVRDVLTGHGPLGALYPTNTTHWLKEGDSMTFLYLLPAGLSDPERPTWGSWAGRYGLQQYPSPRKYFWADQIDAWHGTTHRDNTLLRWAAYLQNDFRARLDWCVQPFAQANHPPRPSLNGDTSPFVKKLETPSGSKLILSAKDSWDPDDNQKLTYQWIYYPEAGNYYPGKILLENASSIESTLAFPSDARGSEFHIVLVVTDDGSPPLAAFRRAIVYVH